ncbi:MAG: phosphoribosylformylglycinamidine synthase subunit PurL [Euryarchaeota archaeon]|nr:phosphoribosylformylglycinamidine synthase subunit PurL [Euryarchaeota archaeon]
MALTDVDMGIITEALGRPPNEVESAIFENLWSEHCAYRSSKPLLVTMPTSGDNVVIGPGDDAAVIKFTDELVLAVAMESHNHPSYVDPYDGAATGVGGIVRDVISMGAKPIALMDCLYFGSCEKEKNRYLFEHVVAGISDYGNCIGVPVVNGEVVFHQSFDGNPLVNVACIGISKKDQIITGRVKTPGSHILLIGSTTGRDGLGGASFASRDLSEESEAADRPSVQIGDPYTEKLLIDATLEATQTGHVLACRDLGAAGLSGASAEMCSTFGGRISLDAVPLREANMSPMEILVSESQERMVFEVLPEHVDEILAIASKYDLNGAVIGQVIEEPRYVVEHKGSVVADIPINLLTEGAPLCTPDGAAVEVKERLLPLRKAALHERVMSVLSSPNIASKEWVYRQYDYEVQTRTIIKPGNGAAVLGLSGCKGIALSSGCYPQQVALDPFRGSVNTVFEKAMDLAVKGAEPAAFVNCLNFGNPERADIYSQLEGSVAGLSHAARILGVPIVGGNVSLYNESEEYQTAIIPTPSIGIIGYIQDVSKCPAAVFRQEGDVIILIGKTSPEYGGSEYSDLFGLNGSVPEPRSNIKETIDTLTELVQSEKITAASVVSRGGIVATLAKMCRETGAAINLSRYLRHEDEIFSESPGRAIISVSPQDVNHVVETLTSRGIPNTTIGKAGSNELVITVLDSRLAFSLALIEECLNALSRCMVA